MLRIKNNRHLLSTILLTIFSLTGFANAANWKEAYTARLSPKDHHSSKGTRLNDAISIVRQDRANFYKFKKRDNEDEPGMPGPSVFESAEGRALFGKLKVLISKEDAKKIVNGTPLITVYVNLWVEGKTEGSISVVVE